MLTPSEYDHLCDSLLLLYGDLEDAILADIVRRLLKAGQVTDMAKWQAERLQESGLLYEDILAEIASRTDATKAHVRTLFEMAAVQSIRNDNRYYRAAGLEGIIKMSDDCLQTLHAGFVKCAGNLHNLTLTTANTAQTAYITACNNAYMQVQSGAFDYNTAIRNAIIAAAEGGSHVLYPSGHRDKLDVAVRRAVMTGIGQTVRQLSLINAKDMGCDLMEITAHAGARPSHAVWQGQIVSLSGRRGYLSLADIGYGSGDGFGGWNCRHDWFPFFEDVSERAYSDADLKKLNEPSVSYRDKMYTEYDLSQMQRAMEREIRKQKRAVLAAKEGVDAAETDDVRAAMQQLFTQESVKLKREERKLREFLQETGLQPENARLWVHGFGRSVSQRAVWANKRALTSGAKSGIIETGNLLARREHNIGAFSVLEMPMQKQTVVRICRKYGIDTSGLLFKIQRDEGLVGKPYFGLTDYDNIGRIDLLPQAFSNEEQLVRTILHERLHVLQLRKYGKEYCLANLDRMERQAYWFEDAMYLYLRKRVRQ